MKDKRGVTLASLTIYIIVLAVVLVVLTFVSGNFTSQISDTSNKGKISNEYTKLFSFILKDIKSANKVVEYSDDYVRFDNNSRYSIKYLGTIVSNDTSVKQYEIYKDNILISENISNASFDYDIDNNIFTIYLQYYYGKTLVEKTQTFEVGRGY